MTEKPTVTLEVDDIQAPLLHLRPTHYGGAVILGPDLTFQALILLPLADATAINFTAPIFATILSAAMMFRHSLGRPDVAGAIEQGVSVALEAHYLTPDLGGDKIGPEGFVEADATRMTSGRQVAQASGNHGTAGKVNRPGIRGGSNP